jgi:hypothetical protein
MPKMTVVPATRKQKAGKREVEIGFEGNAADDIWVDGVRTDGIMTLNLVAKGDEQTNDAALELCVC